MATFMPSLTALLNPRLIIFALTFCGYGVISFFISSSESSQLLTIPYRAAIIFLNSCLLLVNIGIFTSKTKKKDGINSIESIFQRKSFFLILFLFVFIYSCRIVFDTLVRQDEYLALESSAYLLFWFFISLIPGLNYLFLDSKNPRQYLLVIWIFHLMIAIEAIMMNPSSQSEFFLANDRASNMALNPISLGHYGASLCIMSFFNWINFNPLKSRGNILIKSFYLVTTFIGLYITLIAASRGPLIGMLICLALIFVTDKKIKISKSIGILGIIFCSIFIIILLGDGNSIFNRFSLISEEIDTSGDYSRGSLYLTSISFILDNFTMGFGIELPNGLGYPHNLIVESFLSLGLVGGILFSTLFITSILQSLKLLVNRDNQWGWLGLIFIQYAIGSMFSGSLYGSSPFWYSMFAVNGISLAMNHQSLEVK
jgi:hypothetical protein